MNQNTGKFSGEALLPTLAVYAVTDRHWLKPGQKLADQVRETLEAGATFIQTCRRIRKNCCRRLWKYRSCAGSTAFLSCWTMTLNWQPA